MVKNEEKFDIVVVGGGPAGMMAAGRAAELGARVVLIEKNETLGKKLLMTGGGRCNFTQAEFVPREFIEKFQDRKAKFLFSSLTAFGPKQVMEFFEQRKLKSKIEEKRRVFPVTDNAEDVLSVLTSYLKKNHVEILTGKEVAGFEINASRIESVKLKDGEEIFADKFILATGGKSYPTSGSTGDGYRWAIDLGHKVNDPRPALVPVKTKEMWPKYLQGIAVRNVGMNIFLDDKKVSSRIGDILFAHFGLSGPLVLAESRKIGELISKGAVTISIDLFPEILTDELDKLMIREFEKNLSKEVAKLSFEWIPRKLWQVILNLAEVELEVKVNFVSKEQRKKIVETVKNLKLTAESTFGFDQAMVTSGGVELKEVDSKTMKSKIVANLYFAGEILDLDGPTGGYNLQMCWSTGYNSGSNAGGKNI